MPRDATMMIVTDAQTLHMPTAKSRHRIAKVAETDSSVTYFGYAGCK
jgi:hypothetical protein